MTLESHDGAGRWCDLATHPAVRRALAHTRFARVHHHAEVDSTQDTARQEALGAGCEVVVVADRQRRGRGRRGRGWVDDRSTVDGSPTNLAVSVAIASIPRATLVPLATGLALRDVVRRLGIDTVVLKWPNDVQIMDAKVAGILVEHHPQDRPASPARPSPWSSPHDATPGDAEDGSGILVIGVGINLDWRGVEREGLALTSLAEHLVRAPDRADLLGEYLVALDRRLAELEDPGSMLDDYRRACATLSRRVRVSVPGGGVVEGGAAGVDGHGRLVVETAPGRTTAVTAGDVVHVR